MQHEQILQRLAGICSEPQAVRSRAALFWVSLAAGVLGAWPLAGALSSTEMPVGNRNKITCSVLCVVWAHPALQHPCGTGSNPRDQPFFRKGFEGYLFFLCTSITNWQMAYLYSVSSLVMDSRISLWLMKNLYVLSSQHFFGEALLHHWCNACWKQVPWAFKSQCPKLCSGLGIYNTTQGSSRKKK